MRLFRSGLGFDPNGLVNVTFNMAKQPLKADALTRLYQTLGDQFLRLPGVKCLSWERVIPMTGETWDNTYAVPGGDNHEAFENRVGPRYFQTMRIPLLEGREFRWEDTSASGMKIILNRAAEKMLFPGKNAIGQQVQSVEGKTLDEVIGVVGDTKYGNLESPAPAMAYRPITPDRRDGAPQREKAVLYGGCVCGRPHRPTGLRNPLSRHPPRSHHSPARHHHHGQHH